MYVMATDWTAIRKRARKIYNDLRQEQTCHTSHTATEALEQAAREAGVGYGIEGFCDDVGRHGVTYINTGDAYTTTVLFESEFERFSVGCYGDIIENAPEGRYG